MPLAVLNTAAIELPSCVARRDHEFGDPLETSGKKHSRVPDHADASRAD
jgi:hypothetical protein